MNSQEIPAPLLDVFEGLESSPNEAVQRFAGVSRWVRRRRTARTPERIGRELGRAAREEVARVLGQHAHLGLHNDPSLRGLSNEVVRVGERLRLPTDEDLLDDAVAILQSRGDHTGHEEYRHLSALVHNETIDRLQVTLFSWRLCPLANLAHQASIEYTLRREWASAHRFIHEALSRSHSRLRRSYAYENLAGLALAQKNPLEASTALQSAADCGEDRPTPLLSLFVVSLSLEDWATAEESAVRAEGMLSVDSSGVASCIRYFRALRTRGEFDASPAAEYGKRQKLGQHTRSVIDALV